MKQKVNQSIKLLRSVYRRAQEPLEICYSGGKDSDVMLRLAQLADIPYIAIHRLSGIDRPNTLAHCEEVGATIHRTGRTFFDVVDDHGLPTRRQRHCCEELREYAIHKFACWGIRREESNRRKARYTEPIQCRVYHAKSQGYCQAVLPLLEWTMQDEYDFITRERIHLHRHYYNADGSLDLTRRVGCIGCPLASDKGLAELREFPMFARQLLKHLEVWWNRYTHTHSHDLFPTSADILFHNIFCNSYSQYIATRPMDCRDYLAKYFGFPVFS